MPKEKGPEWNYVTVLADGGDKGLACDYGVFVLWQNVQRARRTEAHKSSSRWGRQLYTEMDRTIQLSLHVARPIRLK